MGAVVNDRKRGGFKIIADGTAVSGDVDLGSYVFGREYLYAFTNKIQTSAVPTIVLAGDSTTLGDSVVDSAYLPHNILKSVILRNYLDATIFNDAVSGSNTNAWITSHLAAQIARNPDLFIIRHGLNDGSNNRASFEANLRSGLATIRASKTVQQAAILLMTPNSTNDTPNGRDAVWHESINVIIRKAARDYQCAFIDTYAYFKDSENASGWMDNPYSDGRRIHPLEAMNLIIAGVIVDVIIPRGMQQIVGTTQFINPISSYLTLSASSVPSALNAQGLPIYPKGLSMYRALPANGWQYDGHVVTLRQNDGIWLQINSGYNNNGIAFRTGQSASWGAWQYLTNRQFTVATLPSSANAGESAYVTDATAPTYLGALTGGGSVYCRVFRNATGWVSG